MMFKLLVVEINHSLAMKAFSRQTIIRLPITCSTATILYVCPQIRSTVSEMQECVHEHMQIFRLKPSDAVGISSLCSI